MADKASDGSENVLQDEDQELKVGATNNIERASLSRIEIAEQSRLEISSFEFT